VTWRPARPRNRHGGQCDRLHRISTAKGQGMVKQRYLNRVNIVLRRFFRAHDLFRKPVPIPDHVEDKLFGVMRRGSGVQMPNAGIQPVLG
jgi:hypothetical protein